jgi:hypothetical protein
MSVLVSFASGGNPWGGASPTVAMITSPSGKPSTANPPTGWNSSQTPKTMARVFITVAPMEGNPAK